MSGMVIKSVTACVVSMAAAAGVTWFGTAPDASAGEHPHRIDGKVYSSDKDKMDTKAARKTDRASSSVVVTSEAERAPTRSAPAGSTRGMDKEPKSDSGTTRSVIARMMERKEHSHDGSTHSHDGPLHADDGKPDAYTARKLKKEREAKASKEAKAEKQKSDNSKAKPVRSWTMTEDDRPDPRAMMEEGEDKVRVRRRIVKRMGDDEEMDVEVFVMDKNELDDASEAFRALDSMGDRFEREQGSDIELEIEAELEQLLDEMSAMTDTAFPKAVLGSKAMTSKPGALRSYRKAKPSELLETTQSIEDDDLRDQALYAVTTYALRFDDFRAAEKAVGRIDSRDLRDTARSRVAIRHAELGDIDTAMGVIETLESEDLRDIIRVQMIETLTTPLEKRKGLPGY